MSGERDTQSTQDPQLSADRCLHTQCPELAVAQIQASVKKTKHSCFGFNASKQHSNVPNYCLAAPL